MNQLGYLDWALCRIFVLSPIKFRGKQKVLARCQSILGPGPRVVLFLARSLRNHGRHDLLVAQLFHVGFSESRIDQAVPASFIQAPQVSSRALLHSHISKCRQEAECTLPSELWGDHEASYLVQGHFSVGGLRLKDLLSPILFWDTEELPHGGCRPLPLPCHQRMRSCGPGGEEAMRNRPASVFPRGSLSRNFQGSCTKRGFLVPGSELSMFLRQKIFIDGLFITDVT